MLHHIEFACSSTSTSAEKIVFAAGDTVGASVVISEFEVSNGSRLAHFKGDVTKLA